MQAKERSQHSEALSTVMTNHHGHLIDKYYIAKIDKTKGIVGDFVCKGNVHHRATFMKML